eukprot:gnl/MRDRNA2_/MRDRNA2_33654_c0_seq1.p1 gnl/MRDRNA2_/MRDRNA2_33654_c0~~gnl/MRDRNA2_/MRDRNA2_33654_c0_seq1.p1  ORF type:complete len:309 (+),score=51.07 gnl/MRDRNA2_/MRDRNA2_33654_c0_seq1:95-1021(+)
MVAPRRSGQVCNFWLRGDCKFGDNCKNLHRKNRSTSRSRSRSFSRGRGRSPSRRRSRENDKLNPDIGPGTLWVGGLPEDCSEKRLADLFEEFGAVENISLRSKEKGDDKKEVFAFVKCGRGHRMGDAVRELDQTKFEGSRIKVVNNNAGADKPGSGGGGDRGGDRGRDREHRNSRGDKDFNLNKGTRFESRPGDWYCPNCNDLQFARNDKCRRCGEAKPGGDDRKGDKVHRIYLENLPKEISRDELKDVGLSYGKVISTRLWDADEGDCKHGILQYETEEGVTKAIDDLDGRRMEDCDDILRVYKYFF